MLNMELPERKKRGRPQKRFMDAVQEAMQRAGAAGGGDEGVIGEQRTLRVASKGSREVLSTWSTVRDHSASNIKYH